MISAKIGRKPNSAMKRRSNRSRTERAAGHLIKDDQPFKSIGSQAIGRDADMHRSDASIVQTQNVKPIKQREFS
jgi:hypothetical protein